MRIVLALCLMLFLSNQAQAACVAPVGADSQTRYDFAGHKMYYCNNTNWVEMSGSGGASAAMFSIRKANGLSGGSLPIVGLNYRILNTTVHNSIVGASLAAGTVTLPAGVFFMTYTTHVNGYPTASQGFININGSLYNASSPAMTGWSTYNQSGALVVTATYSSAVPFTVDVGIFYNGSTGAAHVTGASTGISAATEYFDTLSVARLGNN